MPSRSPSGAKYAVHTFLMLIAVMAVMVIVKRNNRDQAGYVQLTMTTKMAVVVVVAVDLVVVVW